MALLQEAGCGQTRLLEKTIAGNLGLERSRLTRKRDSKRIKKERKSERKAKRAEQEAEREIKEEAEPE